MANDTKYYVFDAKNCKHESMTKEQIINAIADATGETPSDVDEGFISTIIEQNNNRSIHVWKGTRAQFNALVESDPNTFYIVDNDTTIADMERAIEELQEALTPQNQDTGWKPITRVNLSDETVTIGRWRVKNGIAYIDVLYYPDEFGSTTTDSFDVPVVFGVYSETEYSAIPFFYSEYSELEPLPDYDENITNIKIVDGSNKATIQIPVGGSNAGRISGHFSMPVSWYQNT